jgi:hypothetical protein
MISNCDDRNVFSVPPKLNVPKLLTNIKSSLKYLLKDNNSPIVLFGILIVKSVDYPAIPLFVTLSDELIRSSVLPPFSEER